MLEEETVSKSKAISLSKLFLTVKSAWLLSLNILAYFTLCPMCPHLPAAPAMQLSLPISVLTCKSQLSLANPFPFNWSSPALVCTKFTTQCREHLGGPYSLKIYDTYTSPTVHCVSQLLKALRTCGDILGWFGSKPHVAIFHLCTDFSFLSSFFNVVLPTYFFLSIPQVRNYQKRLKIPRKVLYLEKHW